jgi:hypothetical protein
MGDVWPKMAKGCGGARPLSKQQTTAPLGGESYTTNGEGTISRWFTFLQK